MVPGRNGIGGHRAKWYYHAQGEWVPGRNGIAARRAKW